MLNNTQTSIDPLRTINPVSAVLRAACFAAEKHAGQRRKGAATEPYINHLLDVAELVSGALPEPDTNVIIAALLHDTIEDVGVTEKELEDRFGRDVATLVAEVTDDKKVDKEERKRLQIETASKKSPRAQMIKIADKTTNLRSVLCSPPDDWNLHRRQQYFEWAKAVVDRFTAPNEPLKSEFDKTFDKFADFVVLKGRPKDEGTRLLAEKYLRVNDVPFVLEKWAWEGVKGRSAVFMSRHVEAKTDRELITFLQEAGLEVDPKATFSRKEEFTFVNFEFVA